MDAYVNPVIDQHDLLLMCAATKPPVKTMIINNIRINVLAH